MPDYLSQVQEEEVAAAVALGVQYELADPSPPAHHHQPVYPSSSISPTTASITNTTAATSSCSSSIQLPVISQLSSSTQHGQGSPPGFLSTELALEPVVAPTPSIKVDANAGMVALEDETTAGQDGDGPGDISNEEQQQLAKKLAP